MKTNQTYNSWDCKDDCDVVGRDCRVCEYNYHLEQSKERHMQQMNSPAPPPTFEQITLQISAYRGKYTPW